MKEVFKKYLKKKIVVDTRSSWVYIGTLEEILDSCIMLTDVDVHDNGDIITTKECYILDSKKTGIKSNRLKVFVNLNDVISFSSLDDVKFF
jgi:small nuclear ribonucleoprotein (snRNP)-like protein